MPSSTPSRYLEMGCRKSAIVSTGCDWYSSVCDSTGRRYPYEARRRVNEAIAAAIVLPYPVASESPYPGVFVPLVSPLPRTPITRTGQQLADTHAAVAESLAVWPSAAVMAAAIVSWPVLVQLYEK